MLEFGQALTDAMAAVRRYKSENNLSMRAPIDAMDITAPKRLWPLLRQTQKDLLACSKAGRIRYL